VNGRWAYATNLLNGGLPGLTIPLSSLTELRGSVPNQFLAQRLAMEMAGGRIPQAEVDRVQQYIGARPFTDQVLRDAAALLAASPGYQFY
jgi:hypothetical protein